MIKLGHLPAFKKMKKRHLIMDSTKRRNTILYVFCRDNLSIYMLLSLGFNVLFQSSIQEVGWDTQQRI